MNILVFSLVAFLKLIAIRCFCNSQLECYDPQLNKCSIVDGVQFIGREKINGFCVIDSYYYEEIDFCRSEKEHVCVSKDRKSCIKAKNSKTVVAISQRQGLCIELDEKREDLNEPQSQEFYNTAQEKRIQTCVQGACLEKVTEDENYCFPLGSKYQDNLIVGVDLQQKCIYENEITEFANSIGCLDGLYCINQNEENKCQKMNPSDKNMVGRDSQTQICLPQSIIGASLCVQGYCLLNGACEPLSQQYPGKQNQTYQCLQEQEEGYYGASECYQEGYVILIYKIKFILYLLSYVKILLIIKLKNQKILLCEIRLQQLECNRKYCIEEDSKSCIKIDIINDFCVGQNGFCTKNGNCKNCEISQCIKYQGSTECQNLEQPSHQLCKDINGICQSIDYPFCYICPKNYCLINNSCAGPEYLLQIVKDKHCFIYQSNLNKCVLVNINVPNQNGNLSCMNDKSFCQDITESKNNCLECPFYFYNPGNQKCYSLKDKLQLSPIPQQLYFDMKLIYVKKDCYDNLNCLNPKFKCPDGCFSCNSLTFCTQCIEGYFLYQDKSKKQICIKCLQQTLSDSTLKPYFKTLPTYQCIDCSSEYGIWQRDNSSQFKSCINFKVNLDGVLQIQFSKQQALNYIVQSAEDPYYLSQNSKLCPQGCDSCITGSKNSVECMKCKIGYVKNNGVCEQCALNCLYCEYATFIKGKAVFKTQLSERQYSQYNFVKICIQCVEFYLVSYDLESCIQCESKCKHCQYENYQTVLNYNQDSLYLYTLEQINSLKIIKKCISCQNGYYVSSDGQSCIENIKNCDYNSIQITQGGNQYDLTEKIWSFVQNNTDFNKTQICKNCASGYILSNNSTQCDFGCQRETNDNKCGNCFFMTYNNSSQSSIASNPSNQTSPNPNQTSLQPNLTKPIQSQHSISCLFCSEGQVLNQTSSSYKCMDDLCSNNILGCDKCYLYQDPGSIHQIYQCLQCTDKYSIPSLFSCKKCPNGCSKCYEGTRDFNFTSFLVYNRANLTIQDKLNYDLKIYELICTQCQDGYYFDELLKRCILINCGVNCLKCILINNQPQCIQCDYNKLIQQLTQLTYFIGTFYFKQNQIPNPQSLITLSSSGNDCQICPLLCESCLNNKDLSLNPLFLYDAQCLSCKKTLDNSYILQDNHITYDKSRRKCYLCKKNDQGCYYKKQKIIYATCLDIISRLGDGSQNQPININRLNDIDLNKLIINEIDYDQAAVNYNELQVKELEVQLIFVNDTCIYQKPQAFGITIKDSFRTLETKLNITTLNQAFQLQFNQSDVFTISGFGQVYVSNISFLQNQMLDNFGLIIKDNLLQDVILQNCSFQQIKSLNHSQHMILSLQSFQITKVVLQQVIFKNIEVTNYNSLININNTLMNSQLYFELSQSQLINVNFQQSTLVQFNMINTTVQLSNLLITQSTFYEKSLMIDLQQNYQDYQNITINFENIKFEKSNFLKRSQLINSNNINQFEIKNITFNNCMFQQTQKEALPLIVSNTFRIFEFNIIQNNITNYNFIQQLDSLVNQGSYNSSMSKVSILDNQVTSQVILLLKINTQQNSNCFINDIYIERNTFTQQFIQTLIEFNGLKQVKIQNITTVDNQFFTSQQYITPQICHLKQTFKEISIQDLNQKSIRIQSNIFLIENSQSYLTGKNLQVQINNVLSNQTQIVIQNNLQDISIFSFNSKFVSNFTVSNVTLISFSEQLLINQPILSKISHGFNFYSATSKVKIFNSEFINLDASGQFNWIQGLIQQISLTSCNFTNFNSEFDINSTRKGGFFKLSTEQLDIKYSQFIFGQALIGGSFFLTLQNHGKLDIFKSTFYNNIAYSNNDFETTGGAIYIDAIFSRSFDVFIIKTEFSNNFALNNGGAISISSQSQHGAVIIQRSVFSDNQSWQGSSINIRNYYNSQTKVALFGVKINNMIQKSLNFLTKLINFLNYGAYQALQYNEPSQVYIYYASNIQIQNSRFQIVPIQYALNSINVYQKIIFQRFLFIQNVEYYYDVNNLFEKSQFIDNLITVKNTQNIYINSSKIKNNQNVLDKFSKKQKKDSSLAFYSCNNCLLLNLQVNNNVCLQCSQGIVKMLAENLKIDNSTFQNNIAQYGSSLHLQQAQVEIRNIIDLQKNQTNQLQITYSKFINNKATFNGGAIYLKQSSIFIYKTLFDKNQAQSQGGALFLENTQQNILTNLVDVRNCTFLNSYARIGGAIGSTTGQRVNQYSSNKYNSNKAIYHGQIIETAPTRFSVSVNKQYFPDYFQLNINNHQGGSFKDKILLRLANEQNEYILNIPSDSFLSVKIIKGNGILSDNKIFHQNGIFNLTKQIQVYGQLGEQIQLQITSDLIKIPNFSKNEQISYYNSTSFIISIQNVKICEAGKIPKKYLNKFDFCQECKETSYSFVVSNTCLKCPSVEAYCYKNKILLPSNLWRLSQTSIVLYSCKNCIGDYKQNKDKKQRSLQRIVRTDQNYYCKEGYIGAICEDCDRSGQFWGEKYFMNLNQKCQKCSNMTITEITYPLAISVFVILVSIYSARCLQNQIQFKLITKIVFILFKRYEGSESSNSIRIIKFFLFQLSIIGIICFYDHNIPNILSYLFIDIGNMFTTQSRIAECFLQEISQGQSVIFKSIYLILVIYLLLVAYLVLHYTIFKNKKSFAGQYQEMIISISVLLYYSLSTLLFKIFRSVNCQKFDNAEFIMEYLSVNCGELSHSLFDLFQDMLDLYSISNRNLLNYNNQYQDLIQTNMYKNAKEVMLFGNKQEKAFHYLRA
ncbi:hypothetical protein ABPG74_002781 [Tetrahymena malaccensis]